MNLTGIAIKLAGQELKVHPVRDKHPVLRRPLEQASADPEQIATWWGVDYIGADIGYYPRDWRVVTVDVDEKKGVSGSASLAEAGLELPETVSYDTPSGGRHSGYAVDRAAERRVRDGFMPGVDLRAGNANVVFYGEVNGRLVFAAAPNWLLDATAPGARMAVATRTGLDVFFARCTPGRPSAAVKAAEAAVTRDGMSHQDMLAAVSKLVKLGRAGAPGVPKALGRARGIYIADYPDAARHWDAAVKGSVNAFGPPPATFKLSKDERKALAQRVGPSDPARLVNVLPQLSAGDDAVLARYMTAALGGELVYPGAWRRWDGKRWAPASIEYARERVRATAEDMGVNSYKQGDQKLAAWLSHFTTIRSAEALLRGQLERDPAEFDAHPDELNALNGIFNLRTGELSPHDPAKMHTRIAGAGAVPDATHLDVDAAIRAIPGPVRPWMQLRFGQAMTGHVPDDDIVLVMQGSGSNAKSTLLGAAMTAMGGYAAIMPEQLLLAQQGDHPTALMELKGIRLAISEELPEGHQLNVKRLKDVSGSPRMKARRMRHDFVEWVPTHSLMVSSNYLPRVAETDHGTWRRLALVRFPFEYVADPQHAKQRLADRRLRPRLESGRDGRSEAMLAWFIEGARQWYEAGMVTPDQPKRVVADTTAWRETSDSVLAFANDRLVFGRDQRVSKVEILNALNVWLTGNGQKEWSMQTLTTRFEGHELFKQHALCGTRTRLDGQQMRLYLGVALRPDKNVLKAFTATNR